MRDQDLWNLTHLKGMVCTALWRSLCHPLNCKLLPTYRTQNIYIQVDVYILPLRLNMMYSMYGDVSS